MIKRNIKIIYNYIKYFKYTITYIYFEKAK